MLDYEETITCELCGADIAPGCGEENYDGYICEDCMQKLSPFLDDLDILSTEDLQEQLVLRRENREKLNGFHPTRSFALPGMTEKIYLDDRSRTFLVTEDKNIGEENPDILSLDEVVDAVVEIEDGREKIGDHLYRYSYDLFFCISLDHSYLSEIRFALMEAPLQFESSEKSFLGFGGFDPETQPAYQAVMQFGEDLSDALMDAEEEPNRRYVLRHGEFSLGGSHQEQPEQKEETSVLCPWCGGRTRIDGSGCCEHCGGNL